MATPNDIATKLASKIFSQRGNHSEAHLSQGELTSIIQAGIELHQSLKDAISKPIHISPARIPHLYTANDIGTDGCSTCGKAFAYKIHHVGVGVEVTK